MNVTLAYARGFWRNKKHCGVLNKEEWCHILSSTAIYVENWENRIIQ
jgi:hypothetical protein